jgi:murein DD-endopeptidase MepM/ murein hydrolase activator NlpD
MIQLVRPCRGHITQRYGNIQSDGMKHAGNDYAYYSAGQVMPEVFAAADGVVLYAGDSRALGWPNPWYFNPDFDRTDAANDSAGNVLVIGHVQNGVPFVTTYSHLESWIVRAGNTVRAGARVATIGNTGRSTGKHLHFELMFKPLSFNTATYGRTDPNPYIIEGLAGQGTITQEDDMAFSYEDKLFIQTEQERRKLALGTEINVALAAGFHDLKLFIQNDGENREIVTRAVLDEKLAKLQSDLDASLAKLDAEVEVAK